jgi:hypothetical protein
VNDFIEVDYIKRFIEKAFSSREALKIPQKRGKSEFNWWDLQDMIEERSYKELGNQKSKINLFTLNYLILYLRTFLYYMGIINLFHLNLYKSYHYNL